MAVCRPTQRRIGERVKMDEVFFAPRQVNGFEITVTPLGGHKHRYARRREATPRPNTFVGGKCVKYNHAR